MELNLGGIVHLSTIDWVGEATTVIFLRGCPLRCPHCQNRDLQKGERPSRLSFAEDGLKIKNLRPAGKGGRIPDQITLEEALSRLRARPLQPFVSGIVLSGGEPLMQPEAVKAIAKSARENGLKIGLETCGYYADRLLELLEENLVDRVFLDIKAALRDPEYERASGVKGVAIRVQESLEICMRRGVSLEVRTTVFPEGPGPLELREIGETISSLRSEFPGNRFEFMTLQRGLPREKEFEAVSSEEIISMARSIESDVDVRLRDYPQAKPSLDR